MTEGILRFLFNSSDAILFWNCRILCRNTLPAFLCAVCRPASGSAAKQKGGMAYDLSLMTGIREQDVK